MKALLSLHLLFVFAFNANAESIVSKDDADYIFTLNRSGWEAYISQMVFPEGWAAKTTPVDTGTVVMAINTAAGYGLLVQPLFIDATSPPEMLIVGSYYPQGTLPSMDDQFLMSIKQEAENDLGASYSLNVIAADRPPFEGVEIRISKTN